MSGLLVRTHPRSAPPTNPFGYREYPFYSKHEHGLTEARVRKYIKANPGETGPGLKPVRCYYAAGSTKGVLWSHKDIMALAAERPVDLGFGTIEVVKIVEKIVEVEVPVEVVREVKVPYAETLSFGEAASLAASLHHGQHLLNEDLRLAMTDNDLDAITLARHRLDDHMSLMTKLGVPPARWDDNARALRRAREIADHHINGSIWS